MSVLKARSRPVAESGPIEDQTLHVTDAEALDAYLDRFASGIHSAKGNPTPSVDVTQIVPDHAALVQIPAQSARRFHGLPLRRRGQLLAVAMARPDDSEGLQAMGFLTDCKIVPLAADPGCLELALGEHYDLQNDHARETAEIAIESALTGHLVLSTLHTHTAATAVTRLLDLGVEPYLLRASLLALRRLRRSRSRCGA